MAKGFIATLFGGLNLCSVNLRALNTFMSSLAQSRVLMAAIMDRPVSPSVHLTEAVSMLAKVAKKDEWLSVDDIDVPLCQQTFSRMIDEA